MSQPAAILRVQVLANTKGATTGLLRFNQQLAATDAKAMKTQGALGSLAKTAGKAGLAGGLLALGLGAKKAFGEFREAQKVTNQTNAVLKSTGSAAKVTAKEIENLADAISMKAGIDDEAIQKGENLLLTFTKIRNETGKGNQIFTEATKVITDMSVALDQDLKSSAIQVGKALQDPEKGITALKRVGVNFTETQKDMITNWLEHGKVLKAQKFILKELNTEFGGSAAAQADNVDKIKVAWNQLFEDIGNAIGPTIEKAIGAVSKFLVQMHKGTGAGGEFVDTLKDVADVLKAAVDILSKYWFPVLERLARLWWAAFKAEVSALKWLVNALQNVLTWLGKVGGAIRDAFVSTFNRVKKVVGDVMAAIFRHFAKLFDIASHLPGIGGKFGDLRDKANEFAKRVDKAGEKTKWLGQKINDLPTKKEIDVVVNLALADLSAGNVPQLKRFPGKPGTGDPGIEEYIEGKARARAKSMNPLAAIGGSMGIVAVGRLLQGMGYHVGENPAFGGVHGVHVPGSYHYRGRAIDVNADGFPGGEGAALDRIYPLLNKIPHAELLWRAPGHYDHLHFAMQRGGGIPGTGSGDTVPAMLEPGEFVMNRNATRAAGPMLAALNSGVPRFASGGMVRAATAGRNAGFKGSALQYLLAIGAAESGNYTNMVGDLAYGGSYGPWQIHHPSHPQYNTSRLQSDWTYAAKAAYAVSGGGSNWGPWTMFRNGGYRQWMDDAARVISAAKGKGPAAVKRMASIIKPKKLKGKAGTKSHTPFGGIGHGGILDAFMQAASDRLNLQEALAALTDTTADDIEAARVAVGTWEQWLHVAQLNNIPGGITSAAQNLKSARDRYKDLTTVADTGPSADDTERANLLQGLLTQANLRTAVSQAQYGVLKNYGGSFADGGVVPGPLGSARVIVAHGGETVTPAGAGGVQVIVNGDIHNVPRGKQAIEIRDIRGTGRAPLPGRGGGWN